MAAVPMTRVGALAALLVVSCLTVTSCATRSTAPAAKASAPASTSRKGAPTAHDYRAGNLEVRAAFPGTPVRASSPGTLAVLLPADTRVTSWRVGALTLLRPPAYELVVADFPPGSNAATIDDFLTRYAGKPNTTVAGEPGLYRLSAIPQASGTDYSGIKAFSVGRVLVMAVGLDTARAPIVSWLGSLRLTRPAR
ncbi:MAG: hypothetical protein ACYCST_01890 [Acidimicrobiales bacterium]